MKNPFSPDAFNVQELKRIPRDLSCRKLFTTEFGKGVPILAQEVFPGDTFKIHDVGIDIQGMPTYFPLTSRLKVSVSFFLCRNRCVDDSWEDFIFNTKEVDKAWIRLDNARAKKMISTGSLGDFFGIPSTVGRAGVSYPRTVSFSGPLWCGVRPLSYISDSQIVIDSFLKVGMTVPVPDVVTVDAWNPTTTYRANAYYSMIFSPLLDDPLVFSSGFSYINIPFSSSVSLPFSSTGYPFVVSVLDSRGSVVYSEKCNYSIFDTYYGIIVPDSLKNFVFPDHYYLTVSLCTVSSTDGTFGTGETSDPDVYVWLPSTTRFDKTYPVFEKGSSLNFLASSVLDSTDDRVIADNLYVGNDPVRKLEAHVFRHYTMIGNYYYRNDRNNPYVLNGEVQYNQFIPTKASGPDDNVYDFFYRNWELDRFTSCCQTPQFGDAPLVGLTYNPSLDSTELTFSATDPEGVLKSYKVTVGLDSDQKLASIANFDKDIPSTILQNVTKMITYGTSINDIRVTNSFQRFLERAQRGLRYRHQMKSHLGVSVDYPDIDIPQYIGGFNGEINSFRNDNTTASEYANLGDFNGSLFGNFSLPNPITVQVPEHGYIMAIQTIVPVPMYPQSVTNKALIKRSPFEYPLQEFMKVGNVPIHYDEVMPLQNGTGQSPDDVFGYNRPWYEYLSNLDEVHGDFRTTLTQFNCVRMFAERPELSADFTTVHPEELNQIFITNNIADKYGSNAKFLCRADFKMTALRQIPDGDPALE